MRTHPLLDKSSDRVPRCERRPGLRSRGRARWRWLQQAARRLLRLGPASIVALRSQNSAGEMQASCIRPFCRLALSLVLAGLSLYAVLLQPTAQLVRTELVRVV